MNTGTQIEDIIISGVVFVSYVIVLMLDIPVTVQIICGVIAIFIMLGVYIKVCSDGTVTINSKYSRKDENAESELVDEESIETDTDEEANIA